MLYCLLCGHWARYYRHPRERGSSSDGTVRHFNVKGGLAEFQVFKTLARCLSYPINFLLYRGYEQNDIGFTRRESQHTATRTADKNGRMWLLHRPGHRAQYSCRIVFAGEIDGFAGKELFDDGQPFRKARYAHPWPVKGNTKLLVFMRPVARTQSKFYTSIGEQVQRCYLSGEQCRVAIIIHNDIAADT